MQSGDSFNRDPFRRDEPIPPEDRLLSNTEPSADPSSGSISFPRPDAPLTPLPVEQDRYVAFGDAIGEGGQGTVYRAVQTSLKRIVALKKPVQRIGSGTATPTEDSRRSLSFVREALTTALLDHPNILQVYDIGEDAAGNPFLAMKLVRGRLWDEVLSEDAELPPAEYLRRHVPILLAVAQAIAFAHSRGVLHRDLNPTQVMVGEFGEVYVMDWGLAVSWKPELLEDQRREVAAVLGMTLAQVEEIAAPPLERASAPAGTRTWMAPEQALPSAAKLGPWTDVYLLGGILYRLLTLTPPHRRNADGQRRLEPLEPASRRASDRAIPRELEKLAASATAHDPAERLSDVRSFAQHLQEFLQGSQRKEEGLRIYAETRASLARRPLRELRYDDLAALERDLGRAIEMNPELPEATVLRQEVLAAQVDTAIGHSDLELARATLLRLPEKVPAYRELSTRLAAAFERRRAAGRRLRALAGALAALLLVAAVLAYDSTMQRAERTAADRTVALLERVAELRRHEEQLGRDYALAFPIPEEIDALPIRWPESSSDAALEARRAQLAAERTELLRALPEGIALLGPPPLALETGPLVARLAKTPGVDELRAIAGELFTLRDQRKDGAAQLLALEGLTLLDARDEQEATDRLRSALEYTSETLGTYHPEFARAQDRLAAAYRLAEFPPATYRDFYDNYFASQLTQWTRATEALFHSMTEREDADFQRGLLPQFIEAAHNAYGERSADYARSLLLAGQVASRVGDPAEALAMSTNATIAFELSTDSTDLERITADLSQAMALVNAGQLARGVELARTSARHLDEIAPKEDVRSREPRIQFASVLSRATFETSASAILREVAEQDERHFGPDHPFTLNSRGRYLSSSITIAPDAEAMDRLLQETRALHDRTRAALGATHETAITLLTTLSHGYSLSRRAEDSLPLLKETLALLDPEVPTESERFFRVAARLLSALSERTDKAEAERLHERLSDLVVKTPPSRDVHVRVLHSFATFHAAKGQVVEQRRALARIVETWIASGEVARIEARWDFFLFSMELPIVYRRPIHRYLLRNLAADEEAGLYWPIHNRLICFVADFRIYGLGTRPDEALQDWGRGLRAWERLLRFHLRQREPNIARDRCRAFAAEFSHFADALQARHPDRVDAIESAYRWVAVLAHLSERHHKTDEAGWEEYLWNQRFERFRRRGLEPVLRHGLPENLSNPNAEVFLEPREFFIATDWANVPPIDWAALLPDAKGLELSDLSVEEIPEQKYLLDVARHYVNEPATPPPSKP